jgi:hypothetical protein
MEGYKTDLTEMNELQSTGLFSHIVELSAMFTKPGHLTYPELRDCNSNPRNFLYNPF